MTVETKETDLGFRKLLEELKKIEKEPYVKVGFVRDEKHPAEGTSLLLIASANEFGAKKGEPGEIPERSFMRSTADKIKGRVGTMIDQGYEQIIRGTASVETVLSKVGIFVQGQTQEMITNVKEPPNKPATIERKGSSNPLIDRGFMRQSVRYQVVKDGDKK